MLATRIVAIATILRGKALALLMHELADSLPQCSGAVEVAGEIVKEAKISAMKIVFTRSVEVEAIFSSFSFGVMYTVRLFNVYVSAPVGWSVYIVIYAGSFHAHLLFAIKKLLFTS